MKVTASFGLIPLVVVLVALFAAVSTAWPQAHHRHGLMHRDRKNRYGAKDNNSTYDPNVSTSVITVLETAAVVVPGYLSGSVASAIGSILAPTGKPASMLDMSLTHLF
jgi:hypothetical protein